MQLIEIDAAFVDHAVASRGEHRAIDVGQRDAARGTDAAGEQSRKVGGASRDVEHARAGSNTRSLQGEPLPGAMQAGRHQIVHQVVTLRHAVEHIVHQRLLVARDVAFDAAGNLKFLNQQPSLGADPCYLTVAASGKFLLVANYTGGSLSVLPIQRDGRLGPATDHVQHEGSSVHENQKGPHAHCIILDRSNRYALAADLGIDKVMIYRFERERGILKPGNQLWASLKPGAGPRHITLHPSERYAYVINEIDSTITVFHYNGVNGRLDALQTVTTLPSDFSGHNDCADVHISSSGNFLYGSNRGHDSIVVFAINKRTGTLTYVEHTSTQGKTPRNFTISAPRSAATSRPLIRIGVTEGNASCARRSAPRASSRS